MVPVGRSIRYARLQGPKAGQGSVSGSLTTPMKDVRTNTVWPSPLITPLIVRMTLDDVNSVPVDDTLNRVVTCVTRSCRKRSARSFVSPATRFDADDVKTTYRPSALIDGSPLSSFACVPSEATLTRSIAPVVRFLT